AVASHATRARSRAAGRAPRPRCPRYVLPGRGSGSLEGPRLPAPPTEDPRHPSVPLSRVLLAFGPAGWGKQAFCARARAEVAVRPPVRPSWPGTALAPWARMSRASLLRERLARPGLRYRLAFAAALMLAPTLWSGLILDDVYQRMVARHEIGGLPGRLDMFSFVLR